ncbi:MAG: metal-dependent transcriptional regulator, partial [Thaumarchaeota archaeon]|nr:metal-dependent transcriptional regulator [Nitrososphaerota archaeon]
KRLRRKGLIQYRNREGAKLLPKGRRIGKAMARNGRLLEVLMRDKLEIPVDPRTVNGIEHYLTERFADALCKMLDHPEKCPHGNLIPQGKCCKEVSVL